MVSTSLILSECVDRVAIITLNRPDKLNALSTDLVQALDEALRAAETDENVGAIVLTGAGGRAFSSGGDLEEQLKRTQRRSSSPDRRPPWMSVVAMRKPVLAAVSGYCYGGGAVLALAT